MNKILKLPSTAEHSRLRIVRKPIKVQVLDESGNLVWERSENAGVACRSYLEDGTQRAIIELLTEALEQAKIELGRPNHTY
jgi:hypothetical protein